MPNVVDYITERTDVQYFFKDVYSRLETICSYEGFAKAKLLAASFTGCKYLNTSYNFSGLAAINMTSMSITVNPSNVAKELAESVPFVMGYTKAYFPYLNYALRNVDYFDLDSYVEHFTCFLILHEVGHYLYTAPNSKCLEYVKKYLASSKIPHEFTHFVVNVVEDSFIQRRLQLDYPIEYYRDCFFLGTTIVQGRASLAQWLEQLSEKTKSGDTFSIQQKLFYFILRAYNLDDADVQSMWDMNPIIGWTQQSLDDFDRAICIRDTDKRCEFTVSVLVPELFDILHEVVKVTQEQLKQAQSAPGSLLDQDKFYEADVDQPSDSDNSSDDSDESDGSDSSKSSGSSGKSSANSDDDSDDESDSGSGDSSDDEDSDEEDSSDGSGSSEKSEESEESEDDSSESSGGSDESTDESDEESDTSSAKESSDDSDDKSDEVPQNNSDGESSSSESDSSTSSESSSGKKADAHKSLEEQLNEVEEAFTKELSEASNNLNESIGETQSRDEVDQAKLQARAAKISETDIGNIINEIRKAHPFKDMSSFAKETKYSSDSIMREDSITLLNTATTLFKRIYTYDTDDMSYLDSGDIDEDIMIDFYTEKSINIFKQHHDLVESKKIKVFFLTDDSGSMYPERAANLQVIIPPLIHAFEENGIQVCLYSFGTRCSMIKDFDDRVFLSGNSSSVKYLFETVHNGTGSTNICPALSAISLREFDDDVIYVMFTFTDGYVDNASLASQLYTYLSNVKHINLFGVTIDSTDSCETLANLMSVDESCCKNYSTDELLTILPQDIYTILVDRFIKK